MTVKIPTIKSRFVIIVDRGERSLGAVISSYLSDAGQYLPLFEFPAVTSANYEPEDDNADENRLSRMRAKEFATFVNNAIAKMEKPEYLILAGLSNDQKSYLKFLGKSSVIEIANLEEVDFALGVFHETPREKLLCRESDILNGLYMALHSKKVLSIDGLPPDLPNVGINTDGIVVIENDASVSSVIALNYAFSINAHVMIVDELEEGQENEVLYYLEEWQKGDEESYEAIKKMVQDRIEQETFEDYEYVTFFTRGLPYSLIIKNSVPCSYVNSWLLPDLFIINNLLYENAKKFGGAVVFSPEFFKDEETAFVSNKLESKGYYVRELTGNDATVYNLDMHLKEFPYDVMHLCSHGGEVKGATVLEKFKDGQGNEHAVEYDQVLGIYPSGRKELFVVQTKMFWRKFDGLIWKSPELKAKNYAHSVFADMENALDKSTAAQKTVLEKNKIVAYSNAIHCSDSNHLGMFSTVASHSSPIIFNNTCWSWSEIAKPFILSGAIGYVGTLWAVGNRQATDFATVFYDKVFDSTIVEAINYAFDEIVGTDSEDIYIYWGLHFSTLPPMVSVNLSRQTIFRRLLHSYLNWRRQLNGLKIQRTIEAIQDIKKWIARELHLNFKKEKDEFNDPKT
jgi:hypothetical protein